MSGTLSHSVGEVVQFLLVDLGICPMGGTTGDYQIFHDNLPDFPDRAVRVTDTTGITKGRTQVDGIIQEHYGITLTIRSDGVNGADKAREINDAFDQQVLRTLVTINDFTYLVQAITRAGNVISLGTELTTTRRLYSINALVDVRQTASVGTGT